MTNIASGFNLKAWVNEAFRTDVPTEIAQMVDRQTKFENVVEEMMTQLPPETRPVVEKLYEMHEADSAMMYTIVGELFKRHLEDHPS